MKKYINIICILFSAFTLFSCELDFDMGDEEPENPEYYPFVIIFTNDCMPGDTLHLSISVQDSNYDLKKVIINLEYPLNEWIINDLSGSSEVITKRIKIPENSNFGEYKISVQATDRQGANGFANSSYRILPCEFPPIKVFIDKTTEIEFYSAKLNGHFEFEDESYISRITEYGFILRWPDSTGNFGANTKILPINSPLEYSSFSYGVTGLKADSDYQVFAYFKTDLEAWWYLDSVTTYPEFEIFGTLNEIGVVYTDTVLITGANTIKVKGHFKSGLNTKTDCVGFRWGPAYNYCNTDSIYPVNEVLDSCLNYEFDVDINNVIIPGLYSFVPFAKFYTEKYGNVVTEGDLKSYELRP